MMRKESAYGTIFDILKIILFYVSCLFFVIPFLISDGELNLHMPSNGIPMLILFALTALFESFDRLVAELKSSKLMRVLIIIEIYVFIVLITNAIIFFFVDSSTVIPITAVGCSIVYFVVKFIRMWIILNKYYYLEYKDTRRVK